MVNEAVPSVSVHKPVAVMDGGGGGATQVDMSASAVKLLSFGLENL